MKKTIKAIIKGNVQGVGFRWFCKQTSQKNNILGYVKNLPDGSVEIVAKGKDEDLKSFLEIIWQGNNYSRVENISVEYIEDENNFEEFKIC